MVDKNNVFTDAATKLSHNPIGIIGLFLVIVDAIAALVINKSNLLPLQNSILVIFIVIFPIIVLIIVLIAFYRLVTKHPGKLYSPSDYKDEQNFVRTIEQGFSKVENAMVASKIKPKEIEKINELNVTADIIDSEMNIYSQISIEEFKTISNVINDIAKIQQTILDKLDQTNLVDESNKNDINVSELKANIERNISVKIPFVLKKLEYMKYPIEVSNLRGAKQFVHNLKDLGYNARVYQPEFGDDNRISKKSEYEAIWLGKDVPVEIAIEVIKMARDFFPHLKYIHISSDGSGAPPGYVHEQIFIGGSTSTAKRYDLKPWLEDDFSKLKLQMNKLEFHNVIRSFYL